SWPSRSFVRLPRANDILAPPATSFTSRDAIRWHPAPLIDEDPIYSCHWTADRAPGFRGAGEWSRTGDSRVRASVESRRVSAGTAAGSRRQPFRGGPGRVVATSGFGGAYASPGGDGRRGDRRHRRRAIGGRV